MIILLHVLSALCSIAYTTYLFFRPSKQHFYISYSLVVLTLLTGIYLAWSKHALVAQSCVSGLIYLAVVASGICAARYRLTASKANPTV